MAIFKAWRYGGGVFAALVSFSALCGTSAPPEVAAAAPAGTQLVFFKSSGDQPDAAAVGVYETPPDDSDVRHRTLIIFGRKDGKLVPEVINDKVIACSKCSQFHDDPFDGDYFKISPSRIHILQMDGGEKPSTTTMDFVRRKGQWFVKEATRESIAYGRYETSTEKLPIPESDLVRDMDGRWIVPIYLNAIVVNDVTGKFSFLHGDRTVQQLKNSVAESCQGQDCRVLVQQQDGCMSLVRDGSGRSFGITVPNRDGRVTGSKDEVVAVSKAMDKCVSAGGSDCKEIRTDCTRGIL